MPDWPQLHSGGSRSSISVAGPEALGGDLAYVNQASSETTAWGGANLALYIPFTVQQEQTIYVIRVQNGATAAGNVDVGIYDDQKNRLVSSGSTAMSGTSTVQDYNITDTVLLPGTYYMAMAMSATTDRVRGWAITLAANFGAMGVLQQASALPLPATSTPVAVTATFLPFLALFGRTGA